MCSNSLLDQIADEMLKKTHPRKAPSALEVEDLLERNCWKRSVAGDEDFNAAIKAIQTAYVNNIGILVSGDYGCGKTALLNALLFRKSYIFRVNLAEKNDLEKLTPWYWDYFHENPFEMDVFLDDLGAEPITNEYGVKYEVVADFIQTWHNRHQSNTQLYISTNLHAEEIDDRYGGRCLSRLKDLCCPLALKGIDKRKWVF